MPADFSLIFEPVLSRSPVDRAAELRGDAEALDAGWPTAAILRVDQSGRFGVDRQGETLRLAFEPAFDHSERPPRGAVFLGREPGGRHLWALGVDQLPDGETADLRVAGSELADGDGAVAAEAVALLGWHRDLVRERDPRWHPRRTEAGWSGIDPFHGGTEFPRTDPAVICLVHDGNRRVLLGRGVAWPERRYSVLAGFVEAAESLENCVRREVAEEVGVRVGAVRYLGSQPWPFPRSLMIAFHAVADSGAPVHCADGELADARWFDVDEIAAALQGRGEVLLPPAVSIARGMIESWVAAVRAQG